MTRSKSPKHQPGVTASSAVESPWNSGSAVKLVEEAFQQHDAASPEAAEFSALRSETWAQSKTTARNDANSALQRPVTKRAKDIPLQKGRIKSKPSAIDKELMSLLSDLGPATLLVNNYFDRIRWFILVFHQDDFRKRFQDLYHYTDFSSCPNCPSRGIGFVAVLLAVFATSLHHIGAQETRLMSHGIDPKELKGQTLGTLKLTFLDVLSRGSLEAVQFCVLLASYYLSHGELGMFWPLSGSGLRIAQALGLHWKMIDTFCSMLYGFPLGFADGDCNVEALDPYDEYSGSTKESRQTTGPSLLLYKCAMSKLSPIVKSELVELYGTRHSNRKRKDNQKGLFDRLAASNEGLQEWCKSLTSKLRFDSNCSLLGVDVQVANDCERGGRDFEDYFFRLQALSLKLAYENAKILIHRPLLSFKMASSTPTDTATLKTDPVQLAIQECREAALQISKVASTPYLLKASETFAIAVVSLQLLTPGVTLCISMTLDPLTSNSAETISGIQQLMQVQMLLKDKSIVAAQNLDITKRLMALLMAKIGNDGSENEIVDSAYQEVPQRHGGERKPIAPEGGSSGPASMPETTIDLNSLPMVNNGSITDTLGISLSGQDIAVYADTSLDDSLLEYEQAASRLFTGDITYNPGDSIQDNPFFEQNQGWIWSWNFLE
ncbi:hypothetical protein FGADI_11138 [Fusarium gaditjirri]|uniref:Xylanolytic transcriptional activator regulatory domain-containing protein n=1 Tax=Fusarium gaditjirri TaxID=282569 RepID=A0A8H4SVL4_9HYPO|nr:hypothetical protein FGADI_11138 [Fusarium gaditjirri]